MPEVLPETVVVVAAHGRHHIGPCLASLGETDTLVIDTGSGEVPGADVVIGPVHPTGAYLWAYEHYRADSYLFIQDSMTAIRPDYLEHFKNQMPALGAVAWATFPFNFDSTPQREWVEKDYSGDWPELGIFGPAFYTNRRSLQRLELLGLLPRIPANREQAQGTERSWAWSFHLGAMPVIGPIWNKQVMEQGMGPFRKVWANRPDMVK